MVRARPWARTLRPRPGYVAFVSTQARRSHDARRAGALGTDRDALATMGSMRQFFVRLLARLSVGRKLLLIYLLDLSAVPNVKGQSHLPIIVDPAHGVGVREYIPALSKAAVACGAAVPIGRLRL